MGLVDVTVDGVRRAIAEFDELGRDGFLSKYGFGRARDYFVLANGKQYDSKAIVGAAHGYSGAGRSPLRANESTGGEKTVASLLESLGFTVSRPWSTTTDIVPSATSSRNPKWADPELILALDLYLTRGQLDDRDPEVVELSELLKRLPIHTGRSGAANFRNANAVALKLANFAALDPGYDGMGMGRGGRRDAELWEQYAGDPAALQQEAARLRAGDLSAGALAPTRAGAPTIQEVAVEALNVESFTVEHTARTVAAQRREQQLVLDFRDHLEGEGHDVVRHRYTIDGRSLYCDLFDDTDGLLYEAKGDVTRELLRMAVGQLLDYARFYDAPPPLAVLLPRKPSADMMLYLASVGVAVVFRDPDGGWQRA